MLNVLACMITSTQLHRQYLHHYLVQYKFVVIVIWRGKSSMFSQEWRAMLGHVA